MRLGDPQRTMLSGTVLSILLICVTPFTGGLFALLFVAQALRGWLQGVVQPMNFSVQAKAVGPYRQGSVVGLRQTMNRLAAIESRRRWAPSPTAGVQARALSFSVPF